MPTPNSILDGLALIANQWRWLAIGWHLYLAAIIAAFVAGWRPSSRVTAALLTVPIFSVGALAWQSGNAFNGGVFTALGLLLAIISFRLSEARVHVAPRSFLLPGMIMVAFGWTYPHFVETNSWLTYTYAAPFGLIPCPTLSVLIGATLMLDLPGSRWWRRVLIGAGLFYGMFGVFRLGVQLDCVLVAGTFALSAADGWYGERMRMRSSIAVVLLIGLASAVSAQTRLRLVSTAWPPFTNAPGETRFASDLVDEALKRIGFTAETVIVDETKFTPTLLSAEYDGSAAAWKDAERERGLLFSDPYLENRLLLIGRKGSDVSAKSLSALAGKRVVLVGGFSYGDAVNSRIGPTFIRSRSEEDSLTQLLAGKADYTLMDDLVVQYILDHYGDQAHMRLAIGTTPLVTRSLHLAIRKERIDAASIIKRFNDELRKMIVDKTYHRLLHVAWITADVDGDGRTEFVAASDRAGTAPPSKSYDLFTSAATASPAPAKAAAPVTAPRFYVGGNIYETWASVPNRYKVEDPNWPDPSRSTASIFKFTW